MVPCPFDCKLSDWSAWAPCSTTCGTGVRIRSRWLKEKPYKGGRPCPKLDPKNQVRCMEEPVVPECWLISGDSTETGRKRFLPSSKSTVLS